MIELEYIYFIIISYLLGSFPSAILVGKLFYNIDVREFGSGNAGATNTFRVLGKKAGLPVLFFDVFKGFISVNLIVFLDIIPYSMDGVFELQLTFGIAAVIGHLFPVFTGFRGGKGIATLLGILIAIHPFAAFYSSLVFVIIFLIFKFVSLASILASFSFPILIYLLSDSSSNSLIIFSIFVPILTLITHQKNIERLIRGEESKAKILKKKKNEK
ncbi:MAG: glycerol-3-phosphate 1-O-acyltransferase PlsY [Flavobacteriales bacterium]|jgi:glycerol-3-phosphate acyltransferase PlsY|tara:strand:+ start:2407 stop:3051 length:645 start_codon:yes stop_codon:yes gene_type:complete